MHLKCVIRLGCAFEPRNLTVSITPLQDIPEARCLPAATSLYDLNHTCGLFPARLLSLSFVTLRLTCPHTCFFPFISE